MGDCVGSTVSLWCTGPMSWQLEDRMLISDLTASTLSADTQAIATSVQAITKAQTKTHPCDTHLLNQQKRKLDPDEQRL